MDGYYDSYQNGSSNREAELQRMVQTIGTDIQKIIQSASQMQRMIPQIGTAQDNHEFQKQLHSLQHHTGELAKSTASKLHELSSRVGNLSQSEQRQWRLQRERLQNDFTKALNSFQSVQRTAAQKEKDVVKKAKSMKMSEPNLIDMDESGGADSRAEQQRRQQMLMQEEYDMEQLQERERSIRQLESDILDVNTIFKDLATLVHDQGEIVDSIEANVESTHIRVEEGTAQLRQAELYKRKARKKKCILAIILIVVLAIVIGIIAWQAN